jgi:hypothetical protein
MESLYRADTLLSWSEFLAKYSLRGATIHLFHMGFHDRAVVRKRYYSASRNLLILKLEHIERKRWLTRDEWKPWMATAEFRILTNESILSPVGGYRFTMPRADFGIIYPKGSKAEMPL